MKFQKDDIVSIKGTDGSEKRGIIKSSDDRQITIQWDGYDELSRMRFLSDGRAFYDLPPILTLIERPAKKEKRKVKGFVNVYRDSESVHDSSYLARAAARGREAIAAAVPFETEIEFEIKQQPGDEPKEE